MGRKFLTKMTRLLRQRDAGSNVEPEFDRANAWAAYARTLLSSNEFITLN